MKTPEEILVTAIATSVPWTNGNSARRALDALDAAGYVIMPKEPDENQLHKGYLSAVECMAGGCSALEVARNIYSAMLAAGQTKETRQSED